MDQLRQMQTFVAVVQAGSFVRAAERLNTSKALVSRMVLDLEAHLGTRLLNRTTRRLSLTDTGSDYGARRPATCAVPHPLTTSAPWPSTASWRIPGGAVVTNGSLKTYRASHTRC